jgi:hypothetical protein
MGVEWGLGAGVPPLSPRLPPPFVTGLPPITSWASTLVRRGQDRWSRRRLGLAYEDKLLHSATRIIQYPCPATVVHAHAVKIQEAGGD